ncbi:MAG: hypothetical protein MJ076_02790 [Clostridia bacterium]|nr:hypothetical protein [Clostridia bacterium]
MRKKDLLNQNMSLFEQLQKAKLEISRMRKEIALKNAEIESLKKKTGNCVAEIECKEQPKEDNKKSEELPQDVEYGAEIIGKIVVSATDYSNKLTAGGETKYRELVNLILGRTEVAKSDILSVISTDEIIDWKKEKINGIMENTLEYFESVMAQIN